MADFNYKLSQPYLDSWKAGRSAQASQSEAGAAAFDAAYVELEKIIAGDKKFANVTEVLTKFYNKASGKPDPTLDYFELAQNWKAVLETKSELSGVASILRAMRSDKNFNYEAKAEIKIEKEGPEYQFEEAYKQLNKALTDSNKKAELLEAVKKDPNDTALAKYVKVPRFLNFKDFQLEFINAYEWFKKQAAPITPENVLTAESENAPNTENIPTGETVLNTELGKTGSNESLNLKTGQIQTSSESEEIAKGNTLTSESSTPETPNPSSAIVNNNVINNQVKEIVNNSAKKVTSESNATIKSDQIVNGAAELLKTQQSSIENSSTLKSSNSESLNTNSAEQDYVKLKEYLSTVKITDESTVKSGKIADSGTIKKALEPDKTLELNVGQLTKTLPEAVNNLTNSMTSIAPQNANSSTVTNEGTKIDQSTNNTITQNQQSGSQNPSTEMVKTEMPANSQMTEFYMQAIYQALISGKMKVRVEY